MENQLHQNCSSSSSLWDNSTIDNPLDSAFSSMVSSPSPNPPNLLRELIGRLGTVYNSNSSPNFPIPFDPGFPRFNNPSLPPPPSSSVQESRGKFPNLFAPDNVEFADSRENSSSISDQIPPPNSRKRKSTITPNPKHTPKPYAPASENSESGVKRSKSQDAIEKDKNNNKTPSSSSSKDNNNKNKASAAAAEAPKDYIHVRARRGQATDAHSLAERVRREKISERMKVLQDLVPGCNKVTGKAVMLDEIINYVQSLQRQVEFLSMKLANIEGGVSSVYHHSTDPNLHIIPEGIGLGRNQIQHFGETSASQVYWEDDLHSFVQMGYGQTNNNTHGGIGMKVEL